MDNNPLPSTSHAPGTFQDNRFKIILVGLVGIASAVLIGIWLPGAGDRSLINAGILLLALVYVFGLSRYAFVFAFLAAAINVQMQPFGFLMSSTILIGALFGPVFLFNIWRKDLPSSQVVWKTSQGYRFVAALALTYVAIHFWYTWKNPYYPFIFANIAKTYYTLIFGFFLILWFSIKPPRLFLPKRPIRFIGIILFIALTFNVIIRGYGVYFLGYGTNEFEATSEFVRGVLFIPLLNISENIYALRMLGPFAALAATVILTSKIPEAKSTAMRGLYILILCLSLIGSLISMGRATIIFTFFFVALVLVWRKSIFPLVICGMAAILTIAAVRIAYEIEPESIPAPIRRTVALIPGMQMEEAKTKIQGSSNWRYEVFQMALNEWRSHPRIFWFGRSTTGVTSTDLSQFVTPEFRDSVVFDLTIKRGATHNMLTDYLVVLGLIGAIIFFILWLVAIGYMFRLARSVSPMSAARQFFIIAAIFTAFQLIYGIIGGATFPIESVILTCLGISYLIRLEHYANSKKELTSTPSTRAFA